MSNPRLANPSVYFGPFSVAADTEKTWVFDKAEFVGEIVRIVITNNAAVSANATNYVELTFKIGAVTVASFSTAATAFSDSVPVVLTLSTVADACKYDADDLLALDITMPGTGAAITDMFVAIKKVESGYAT